MNRTFTAVQRAEILTIFALALLIALTARLVLYLTDISTEGVNASTVLGVVSGLLWLSMAIFAFVHMGRLVKEVRAFDTRSVS